MEAEHCKYDGHDREFETTNYQIKTCPSKEWNLIVRREGKEMSEFVQILLKEFPDVKLDGEQSRTIPDVSELLNLKSSREAGLRKEEIYAIVLYTGPMV